MSTLSQPLTPSIAAEPVSPLVAPTIVIRSPRCGEHVVEHPPDELQRDVLERQRRAVEQLEQPLLVVDLHERHDGRVAERGVGVATQLVERAGAELVADERRHHRGGDRGVVVGARAGRAAPATRSGTYRPPSVARPASSASAKPSSGALPRVET